MPVRKDRRPTLVEAVDGGIHTVQRAPRRVASRLVVLASTPEGMEFAGVDADEQSLGDYAFAPANTLLTTTAKSTSRTATYSWTYSTIGLGGQEQERETSGNSITFRLGEGLHAAPVVTATDSTATATHSLAADGIWFGRGKQGDHDCVNYQPALCDGYYVDTTALTLNSEAANEGLNYIWAGVGISGFHLRGFAETFTYAKPYYLEAVTAEVYSPEGLVADDIEAHVVARVRGTNGYRADTTDLMPLHVATITASQREGRYRVVFEPDTATLVSSSVIVRIQTPEGSTRPVSIVFPQTKVYNSDNAGVCSLYADFKIGNSQVRRQVLDFSGIEMADDSGATTGYLSNFMIGLRKSYEKPGTTDIGRVAAGQREDGRVYDLSGRCVGDGASLQSLPRGVYIVNGRKIIK